MSSKANRRLNEAYRQSAALIPAWRSAVDRAIRRHELRGAAAMALADAAREVGLARLARGIATSRRSLDRLMEEAFQLARSRWNRSRSWPPPPAQMRRRLAAVLRCSV